MFGDYIDVHDISQSKEDKATVPIHNEARLAKIDLKPVERPKIDPNFEEGASRTGIGSRGGIKESLRRKWAQLEAMVGRDKRIALVGGHCVVGKNAQTGDAIGHKNDFRQFQHRVPALSW